MDAREHCVKINPIPELTYVPCNDYDNITFARNRNDPNVFFILNSHTEYCAIFNVQTNRYKRQEIQNDKLIESIKEHTKNCCACGVTNIKIDSTSCYVLWKPQFLFTEHPDLLLAIGTWFGNCKHLWYAALNTKNFQFEQFSMKNKNQNISIHSPKYCIFYDFVLDGIDISLLRPENVVHIHKNYVMLISKSKDNHDESTALILQINYGHKPQFIKSIHLQKNCHSFKLGHCSRLTKDKHSVKILFMGGLSSQFKQSFCEISINFHKIDLIKSKFSCKINHENKHGRNNDDNDNNDNGKFVCVNYCPVVAQKYIEQSKHWHNYHSSTRYRWHSFGHALIDDRYLLVFGGQFLFDDEGDVEQSESGCFICYDFEKLKWKKLKCRLPIKLYNHSAVLMKYNNLLYLHIAGGKYRPFYLNDNSSHYKYVIQIIDTWKQIRIVWMGYYKNKHTCHIGKLSKEVVKYICSYIYQPDNIVPTLLLDQVRYRDMCGGNFKTFSQVYK